ncbi:MULTISPECIES: hypothetical protein [Pseudofrankia]|uniref:hypothetical protein n=1 Tax=Pseudofrankia TaxID=2994363 RepID=UPI000234B224|nr:MULTISPECIES: hypothetical protein [Pseudofrankia]OHV38448.1 hypothetical protein BCD49_13315 [Pseudofrankia sp. EUN1h]
MAKHHSADSGHVGGHRSPAGTPGRHGQARSAAGRAASHSTDSLTGRAGRGATRAVRGLMVGALVAGPLAVLTALPARADSADTSLFDRPLDVRIDIDDSVGRPPAFDLDRLGQAAKDAVSDLMPASGTGSGSGTTSGSGTAGSGVATGGGTGTSGGSAGKAGPAPGAPADANPAPADGGPAAALDGDGQATPVASASTADSAPASAASTDASSAAVSAVAADPAGGDADLVVAHGSLLSSSDSSAIVALDVLAVLLAGVGLAGIPATALLTRRRG